MMLHSSSVIRKTTTSHSCCGRLLQSSAVVSQTTGTKYATSIVSSSATLGTSSLPCCNNGNTVVVHEKIMSTSSFSTCSGHSDQEDRDDSRMIQITKWNTDHNHKQQQHHVNIMTKSATCPRTGKPICRCNATSKVSIMSYSIASNFSTKTCPKAGNDICLCSLSSSSSLTKSSSCSRTGAPICHCNSTAKVSNKPYSTATDISKKKCSKTGNDVCLCSLSSRNDNNISFHRKEETTWNNVRPCPKTGQMICRCPDRFLTSKLSSLFFVPRRCFSSTGPPGTVMVSMDDALQVTTKALQNIGWDVDDATIQAQIMVHAELCGNNQGLVKMYQPEMMKPAANCSKPTIERNALNSAVVNGNQSPGMVTAITAANAALEKLQKNNDLAISIVCSYNSSTSSGQLAYYVEMIAKRGFIGIAMCNSPELVAPAQGSKPTFGTNPLAVGIPQASSPYPFTFDMATSAIALFGVLTAKSKGEPLPDMVAYDKDGNWTKDANQVLDHGGAIATFGGHKGMGLSLCVELLAGGLSGSAVLGQVESKKIAKSWGHTFIAIRPELLVDDYPTKVHSIIETVKQSGPYVRIPGERSAQTAVQREKDGYIPIPEKIWESITRTAQI